MSGTALINHMTEWRGAFIKDRDKLILVSPSFIVTRMLMCTNQNTIRILQ